MLYYINKKNGQMFEQTAEVDPKYNTLMLRNIETGKETTITTSTFKRWYKKVEEPVQVVEEHTVEEQVEQTATVEEQVEEPTAEVTKEAVEEPVKKVTADRAELDKVIALIDEVATAQGLTYFIRNGQPFLRNYKFSVGYVQFVVYTQKQVRIKCKSKLLPEEVADTGTVIAEGNKVFDRMWTLTANDADIISNIITGLAAPVKKSK
jgi:hypothetical protein